MKDLGLKYFCHAEAETELEAWEKWSLPLGNGYFGANVFGRTETERIQLTENSLANPVGLGGLNNFAEIFIDFGHKEVSEYERSLSLNTATSDVKYVHKGISYKRTYFTSYPDKVMVIKLDSSAKASLNFNLRAEIPYIGSFCLKEGDGAERADRLLLKAI